MMLSILDYLASSSRITNQRWMGKDLEGRSHILIDELSQNFIVFIKRIKLRKITWNHFNTYFALSWKCTSWKKPTQWNPYLTSLSLKFYLIYCLVSAITHQ
jgi:hypothetical protein